MADMGDPAPARLFVLLAREAPLGVVLRSGPSEWVQIILWHTDTDTFEFGQSFHGRIYERGCDISPNGSLFLYCAADHRERVWHAPDSTLWQWTALSRPPYLTALTLWQKMDDGSNGGGYFADGNTIYLSGEDTETSPTKGRVPQGIKVERLLIAKGDGNDIATQYSLNGWSVVQERVWQYPPGKALKPEIVRKDRNHTAYGLLQETSDFHHFHYSLRDHMAGAEISLDNVTWADFDHRNRIAFARDGKLFVIEPGAMLESAREIADFNGQRFSPVVAPESATRVDARLTAHFEAPTPEPVIAPEFDEQDSFSEERRTKKLLGPRGAVDLGWILGMIQYGVCLAGGGAVWFLIARNTDFFGDDILAQSSAFLLLLALVVAEAGWIHIPGRNEHIGDYVADFLSSGAIAAFGMAVTLFIGLSLPH